MKNKVVIFGLGDFARIASVYLSKDSPHEVVGFTANERYIVRGLQRARPGMPVTPHSGN